MVCGEIYAIPPYDKISLMISLIIGLIQTNIDDIGRFVDDTQDRICGVSCLKKLKDIRRTTAETRFLSKPAATTSAE